MLLHYKFSYKWSNQPEYTFLSVVNNEVSYYYSNTCGCEIDQSELTFDPLSHKKD